MNYRTLRSRVIQYFSTGNHWTLAVLLSKLTDGNNPEICERDSENWRLKPKLVSQVNEIVHELLRCGILAPNLRWEHTVMNPQFSQSAHQVPLQVTDYGRRLIAGDLDTVWDPTGFLSDIRGRFRGLKQLELAYLEESIRAYHLSLYRASAVMLGAASEALLARIITETCQFLPNGNAINKKLDTNISAAFDAWRRVLDQCSLRQKSELLRSVDNAFELIRLSRNEAAHPKKVDINRLELEVMLVGFKRYAKALFSLRNQLCKP